MTVKPIKTAIVDEKFDLLLFLDKYLSEIEISHGDVLVIASKIVSIAEGRMIDDTSLVPSEMAYALANEYYIEPSMAQAVMQEADMVLGGVPRVITSLKNGIIVAFAGIDRSNVPPGKLVLWPLDPAATAEKIHQFIKTKYQQHIAVIISDSQIVPLRAGTYGVAIGIAGFRGMLDQIGSDDLFGNKMLVTRWNIADNLASAANLVMGETTQSCPLALIHEAPIDISQESAHTLTAMLSMEPSECMIFGCLKSWGSDFDDPSLDLRGLN